MDLFEVVDGKARPIEYRPEMFDFGSLPRPDAEATSASPASACTRRSTGPTTTTRSAVFLGASYFRAVGRNRTTACPSRGLSLNTADAGGEEFPAFRAFWLERPQPGTNSIVVSALLDSPSCAARHALHASAPATTP